MGGKGTWCCHREKTGQRIVEKGNDGIATQSSIALLGIHPKESEAGTRKDICVSMLTAASLTRAKTWERSQCLSTNERINKVGSIRARQCARPALKGEEILARGTTWRNPEVTISEKSHSQKDGPYIIPPVRGTCLEESDSLKRKEGWWVLGAGCAGKEESAFDGGWAPVWEDAKSGVHGGVLNAAGLCAEKQLR